MLLCLLKVSAALRLPDDPNLTFCRTLPRCPHAGIFAPGGLALEKLILTLHIIVCVVLVILVLLQSGKEGMGVIFGGGSSSLFGSSGAGGVLVKLTTFIAVVFLATSLGYNILTSAKTTRESTILDITLDDPSAPAKPAPPVNATVPFPSASGNATLPFSSPGAGTSGNNGTNPDGASRTQSMSTSASPSANGTAPASEAVVSPGSTNATAQ